MTGLLVSVRDAAEARLAVEAGVDLVDVKEPRRGALGSADDAIIRQVVAEVQRHSTHRTVPISVALGELCNSNITTALPLCDGVGFAKIGLAGCATNNDWPQRWAATFDRLPAAVARVAVVYADWQTAQAPEPDEILRAAAHLNCSAALVDTFDKNLGGLVDLWSLRQIERFISSAQDFGMLAVIGGGLTRASIPTIISLSPDYVAVRGAACQGERWDTVSRQRVEQLVQLVRRPAMTHSRL
jgi:(5-formylfuran-3-yl)methyl phosphate synthase